MQPSAANGVINRHHLFGAKEIDNSTEITSILILKWHLCLKEPCSQVPMSNNSHPL